MAIELTPDNWDETLENPLVLVDFWASWCGPCRSMAPVLEEVAEARPELVVASLDVEAAANAELVKQAGMRGIPYFQAYRNGELVADTVGAMPKAKFALWLDNALS